MRLLLSILAAMLMIQSANAQALWRNYWTTNRYPQNALSLTNLQSTNIAGTIPPSNLSTNTPSAGQVLTATSGGSAAWSGSLTVDTLNVSNVVVTNPPYLNLSNSTNLPATSLTGIAISNIISGATLVTGNFTSVVCGYLKFTNAGVIYSLVVSTNLP